MAVIADLLGVWVDGPKDDTLPQNTAFQIDMPSGSAGIITLTLVDSLVRPVELALAGADKLVFSVKRTLPDGVLFYKNATALAEPGKYTFALAQNDTIDFAGKFLYDIWALRSGALQQVKATAYFNLTPRIAQAL